ncbi:MAG: hypothetical protein U1F76_26930 [Candidatus Competibacteraceae bacterium]
MPSAHALPTESPRLKHGWLRMLMVWLLVPALSLQAPAFSAPWLLLPHGHRLPAGTAAFDCHTHPEHSAPTVGAHDPAAQHSHSPDHPEHHRLADACSCVCCVACPIPITGPLPLVTATISRYPPVAQYFLSYISDQPQPPPRG